MIRWQVRERVQMQLPNLGHGGQYRRGKRSISRAQAPIGRCNRAGDRGHPRGGDPGRLRPVAWDVRLQQHVRRTTSAVIEVIPTVGRTQRATFSRSTRE
jgi:hypothetical protein